MMAIIHYDGTEVYHIEGDRSPFFYEVAKRPICVPASQWLEPWCYSEETYQYQGTNYCVLDGTWCEEGKKPALQDGTLQDRIHEYFYEEDLQPGVYLLDFEFVDFSIGYPDCKLIMSLPKIGVA